PALPPQQVRIWSEARGFAGLPNRHAGGNASGDVPIERTQTPRSPRDEHSPPAPTRLPGRLGRADEGVRVAEIELGGLVEGGDVLGVEREVGGGEVCVELLEGASAEDDGGDLRLG